MIFHELKNINQIFEDKDSQKNSKTKMDLLQNATKIGMLQLRGNTFLSWSSYYSVLVGPWLYFFNKYTDLNYYAFLLLKDAAISEAEDLTGIPFSMKIIDRKGNAFFISTNDNSHYLEWIKVIQAVIKKYSTHKNASSHSKRSHSMDTDNQQLLKVDLKIDKL